MFCTMHVRQSVFTCLFLSLLIGGCVSARMSPLNYGVRHLQGDDSAAAFAAAHTALIDLGYKIDRSDPTTGVIKTEPILTTPSAARTSVGTRLRPSSRLRRLATVRVGQGAGVVNVYARVALQEQTTEAHRMFQRDHAISDIPGDTPIDREAATTSEQNTVWRTIGRDRAAERRILEAILEETGGESG